MHFSKTVIDIFYKNKVTLIVLFMLLNFNYEQNSVCNLKIIYVDCYAHVI